MIRSPAFIFCGLLAVSQAAAQVPAVPKPEDRCSVEGTVVNAINGEPLKSAHVKLVLKGPKDEPPYVTTTNSAGRFLLDDLDRGRYYFVLERNGFIDWNHEDSITLAAGQNLRDRTLKMICACSFSETNR